MQHVMEIVVVRWLICGRKSWSDQSALVSNVLCLSTLVYMDELHLFETGLNRKRVFDDDLFSTFTDFNRLILNVNK